MVDYGVVVFLFRHYFILLMNHFVLHYSVEFKE